jgi:hypothetical protein
MSCSSTTWERDGSKGTEKKKVCSRAITALFAANYSPDCACASIGGSGIGGPETVDLGAWGSGSLGAAAAPDRHWAIGGKETALIVRR